MASLLYPERKKPSNKNFLRNHVNDIRVTQKENRQRRLEVCNSLNVNPFTKEQERSLDISRLRATLLKETIPRYDKPRSSSRPPNLVDVESSCKPKNAHADYGKVPEYIKRFEADKLEEEKRRMEIAEASKVPKGCRYMSDEERKSSLDDVRRSRTCLLDELKSMPLNLTTLKQRRRKIEIDLKLCELDKLLTKLEKNCVLIKE